MPLEPQSFHKYHHHRHYRVAIKYLGLLLTRSGLTHPEVFVIGLPWLYCNIKYITRKINNYIVSWKKCPVYVTLGNV
jgi:hypothetical protein